jgi:hypothetical protein
MTQPEPLTKAAQDFVGVLYQRCPSWHDFEAHDLQGIERYLVRRWLRNNAETLLAAAEERDRLREALESGPPYHDDRGDLQEAWARGWHAARRFLAATTPPAPPAPVGELDAERLGKIIHAEFRSQFIPTHIDPGQFQSPGYQESVRQERAEFMRCVGRIAAEYARLTAQPTPEPES